MNNNTTNNKAEQHTEHINTEILTEREFAQLDMIVSAILKPRSSGIRKLSDYVSIETKTGGESLNGEVLADIRLALAKSLWKSADVREYFSCMHEVSFVIKNHASRILKVALSIREATGKKPASRAAIHSEMIDYINGLVEGTIPRADGLARDLKALALEVAYRRGNENLTDSLSVDKALDKVYASARRQAKKNAVEIGGKSNKPTKDECKRVVLEILLRMVTEHEHEFEVIIEEC